MRIGTPLVGRDAELDTLESAYSAAVERGCAHVVNVIGDAGVGKSRLLDEFSVWIEQQPDRALVLRGRSAPDRRAMPRSVLRGIVAQVFGISDDDVSTEVATKLRAGLASLTSRQAEVTGHWLGFDLDHSEAVRELAGNPEFGSIALGHVSAHLQWLVDRAPIVMLQEDLHWADPESLDVIGHLVDTFQGAPILVVCATRPSLFDHRPHWSAGPNQTTTAIELSRLDNDDVRLLARHLLHRADAIPTELMEFLVDRANGNPLHVEELIAMLVDDRIISTDRRPWEVDMSRLDRDAVPTTLAGVLRTRLGALGTDELAVLQHASIIGREFWDDALVSLATATGPGRRTHGEVASTIETLHEREFVVSHQLSVVTGCQEHAFKHALVRDASRESLPRPEHASLHRAAASWLERRVGPRIGEHAGVLAEHLSQAGELDRAADLLHEAGARAGATGARQSAIGLFERSLDCRTATGTGHGLAATSARIELGHLLASVGQNDAAAATYARATIDASESGSHRLAANALAGALRTSAARGDWDESERLVERARPLAERFGGEILGRFLSGHALLLLDGPNQDLAAAQLLAEQALDIWRQLDDPASELRALNELGLVSRKAGRLADADRWYEEALALARRVGDTSGEWMLLQNQAVLAHLEARAGRTDYTRVLELYRSSLDHRRRLGLPYILSLANLAQAEVEAGNLDDGRRDARESLRIGWNRHDPLDWTISLITFAQLAFVTGELTDGLTTLGAIRAERGTPSIQREIDAVLAFHGIDPTTAERLMATASGANVATIVDRLLDDPA